MDIMGNIIIYNYICLGHCFLFPRKIVYLTTVYIWNAVCWLISWHHHNRTKEQLGYTVDSSPRMTYRMLAYCFQVMSSKYSPIYLQSRIDNFIDGISDLLVCLYYDSPVSGHVCFSMLLLYCFLYLTGSVGYLHFC